MEPRLYDGIVVNYGHGGMVDGVYQTPGGKQYHFTDAPPLAIYEGVVNRQIAARVIALLLQAGVCVRDAAAHRAWTEAPDADALEQRDISLGARTTYANRTPSWLYLSIHSNAAGTGIRGPSHSARGIEVYTSPGQTAADRVADSLLDAFRKVVSPAMPMRRGDWSDGDGDNEADFHELRRTAGPAVLGEVGFFTNRADAAYLLSSAGQANIADAYVRGVLPFLKTGSVS